jgi:hypothetical protein
MPGLEAVIENLEGVRAQTLARLRGLAQGQLDWRPPADDDGQAWSLGEVFMHIAIDEIYVRELISRPLLEGISPPQGVTFYPPPPPYGMPKEVILFWLQRARHGTLAFLRDIPEDADLARAHAGGLEPMTGIEWLHGYASHEAYHAKQIDRLTAAQQTR